MSEAFQLDRFTDEDKEFMQKTLECEGEEVFDMRDDTLYIPFAFARSTFVLEPRPIERTEKNCVFVGTLRDEQKRVRDYVVGRQSSAIVSACPGFGKTITALSIACEFGVKTAILVNKLVLIDQWKESIERFVPSAGVEIVTPRRTKQQPKQQPKQQLDDNATFYIVNAINVQKYSQEFWSKCKFVIVDELHQIITKKLVVSLLRFVPDVILGLSATPYRHDEYDRAIKWFFGTNIIGNELNRKHTFRIVHTGWAPENIRYTNKGLDWGKILEDQSENEKRNCLIVRECKREVVENGRTVLVLVKRVAHAEVLFEMIKSEGIRVSTLVRSEKTFDKSCRVLIGTTSKVGVGFDHVPINCLVVASDIKNYFVQFLGRCMRDQKGEPAVVDFCDNFSTLQTHLRDRIKEYKKHGGIEKKNDDTDEEETTKQVVVVARPRFLRRR